jgi:serine/threonine-protein kinase
LVRAATKLVDRYELGPLLGQGGMARVYRGTDRTLGRPVAVKVLAEPFNRDRAFVARFRREARAAARLADPNIVSVFDTGSDGDVHFIVMELVDGRTLADRLERDGPFSPNEVARIGAKVARALAAAHERGVVHRDVKPGNVMLTDDGGVKVVDFGIARASSAEEITRTGVVLGSPPYISPEQARGSPGDERSDLYGVGCVLYEMLTGRPPFQAEDPVATLYRHVHEDPPPPSSVRPVPADLERVVLRCLQKDPAHRFASARELEMAMAGASVGEPSTTLRLAPVASEPTVPVHRRRAEPRLPSLPDAPDRTVAETGPGALVRHRHRPPRLWWPLVAAVGGALLITALALLVFEPVRLPTGAVTGEESPSPEASPTATEPTSVSEAADRLHAEINAAAASGGIFDEDVTAELLDDTEEVAEAHTTQDAGWFWIEYPDLIDEIETAVADGMLSDDAATAIGQALEHLITAIETDPLDSPPPSADDDDDD